MRKKSKRHFLLLEVLIAFALVVLCAFPLIYPMTYILKSQKQFGRIVDLDHYVNLIYVEVLERLYKGEIDWDKIESGATFDIDSSLLEKLNIKPPFPYKGTYKFVLEKKKPNNPAAFTVYLYHLNLNFESIDQYVVDAEGKKKLKTLEYPYLVCLVRNIKFDEKIHPEEEEAENEENSASQSDVA